MKLRCSLRLLFLASLLLVSSALSPSDTSRKSRPTLPDEAFLARLCAPQRAHPATTLPWCQQLHSRRPGSRGHHHRPMPPPGRDGEEVDVRYGVSKRLVPSGPNPLHN